VVDAGGTLWNIHQTAVNGPWSDWTSFGSLGGGLADRPALSRLWALAPVADPGERGAELVELGGRRDRRRWPARPPGHRQQRWASHGQPA